MLADCRAGLATPSVVNSSQQTLQNWNKHSGETFNGFKCCALKTFSYYSQVISAVHHRGEDQLLYREEPTTNVFIFDSNMIKNRVQFQLSPAGEGRWRREEALTSTLKARGLWYLVNPVAPLLWAWPPAWLWLWDSTPRSCPRRHSSSSL